MAITWASGCFFQIASLNDCLIHFHPECAAVPKSLKTEHKQYLCIIMTAITHSECLHD